MCSMILYVWYIWRWGMWQIVMIRELKLLKGVTCFMDDLLYNVYLLWKETARLIMMSLSKSYLVLQYLYYMSGICLPPVHIPIDLTCLNKLFASVTSLSIVFMLHCSLLLCCFKGNTIWAWAYCTDGILQSFASSKYTLYCTVNEAGLIQLHPDFYTAFRHSVCRDLLNVDVLPIISSTGSFFCFTEVGGKL